ncbi:hypothetical protein AS589_07530 [Empedobacter brevis]|uniref:hypothetical protein n=1 Tax=Empedobacter brevis TaxID=247 RepID=UPI00131F50FC|nr:hypothetical protein [Empedobacter brevis]QHC84648.1 hypothetical protein AS589_07530 [Empedobacter brevis]
MSKNIGKIIRVDVLPPKMDRFTNVIYQVSVPGTATYVDYAVDENGDVKTPTLDKNLVGNDFSKIKTVNGEKPAENGDIEIDLQKTLGKGNYTTNAIQFQRKGEKVSEDFITAISDNGVASFNINLTDGICNALKVNDELTQYSKMKADAFEVKNSASNENTAYMNGKIKMNNTFDLIIPPKEGTLALKEEISLNTVLESEEKSTTDKIVRIKTGGSIYVNNGEDFDEKWGKFFYTSSSSDNVTVATGIFNQKIKTWNYPTFYGSGALYSLNTENIGTSKSYTTAIGTQSMYNFIGTLANSAYNTALGYRSMYGLKGGVSNIALGALALRSLTEGSFNVAIGTNTGSLLTSGNRNVLIGHAIGETGFTSGSSNTIIGTFTQNVLGEILNNNVIIGSGLNRVCFRVIDSGLTTIPQQTNDVIENDTSGKAVITKEYLNFENIYEIFASATEEQKQQFKMLFGL